MKRHASLRTYMVFFLLTIFSGNGLFAIQGVSLEEDCRISRYRISEERLDGNVIFICVWSAGEKNSIAILPRVQKYWETFKSKPFIVIGSHLGPASDDLKAARILEKLKITFPVYKTAKPSDTPPNFPHLPFFIVINGEKKIRYCGRSDLTAIETAQNEMLKLMSSGNRGKKTASAPKAIAAPGRTRTAGRSLIEGVELDRYRSSAGRLMLGKNIRSIVRRIKSEKERYPNAKFAAEADAVLSAIQAAKITYLAEIRSMKNSADPKETLKLLKDYARTFPETIEPLRPLYNELKSRAESANARSAP